MLSSIQQNLNIQEMEMEESIYNIIPKQYLQPTKEPIYKSKYSPYIKPTGSTLCTHTTSKPLVSNLAGQSSPELQTHAQFRQTKTFGHLRTNRKTSPDNFLKKKTGTMGNETLPPIRNFSYDCKNFKDPVPSISDKPVFGLKSNKNFILTNAIENILYLTKNPEQPIDGLKKRYFGPAPEYLNQTKQNINIEYKIIQNLHEKKQRIKVLFQIVRQCLTEYQVKQIREGLKRKWYEINKQYQKMTHVRLVDKTGSKRRKKDYEQQLALIESDIKKLYKLYVFVE